MPFPRSAAAAFRLQVNKNEGSRISQVIRNILGKLKSLLLQVLWGSKDLAITGLAWMREPSTGKWRLFSGGLDGSLVEWDLLERKASSWTDAIGGAVWSIAVQPQCPREDTEIGQSQSGGELLERLLQALIDFCSQHCLQYPLVAHLLACSAALFVLSACNFSWVSS